MNWLGKNWKGVTGGALLIATGIFEVVVALKDGTDLGPGVAKIAAGLAAVGIRDAMGRN